MQLFAVLALCVVGALAAPNAGYGSYDAPAIRVATPYASYGEVKTYETPIVKKFVPIVRYSLNDDNYGTFNLETVSGDGTQITESGTLKNLGDKDGPSAVKTGSYSFVADDGKTYTVNWSADERGFLASGAHLPVPVEESAELKQAYAEANAAVAAAPASSDDGMYRAETLGYSGYEAPVVRAGYAATVIRSGYEAPVIRSGYEAPVIRSGYEAPVVLKTQTYEAPNIRVVSTPY